MSAERVSQYREKRYSADIRRARAACAPSKSATGVFLYPLFSLSLSLSASRKFRCWFYSSTKLVLILDTFSNDLKFQQFFNGHIA